MVAFTGIDFGRLIKSNPNHIAALCAKQAALYEQAKDYITLALASGPDSKLQARLSEYDNELDELIRQAAVLKLLVEARKATRTYNDSALLHSFWVDDLNSTLHSLMEHDVVRLSWQWSKLQAEANRRDVSLRIAKHEVADGDDEHVGELWATAYEPKARP